MAIERISGGGQVSYVQGGALGGGAEGACVPRILAVLIPRIPGGSRRASADGERARGCWWGAHRRRDCRVAECGVAAGLIWAPRTVYPARARV